MVEFDELLSVVMWLGKTLIGILVINTLTMLTIAHADRGRPTLNDDERLKRYTLRIGSTPTFLYFDFLKKRFERNSLI